MTNSHPWRVAAASRIDDLAGDERAIESRLWLYRSFSNIAVVCGIAVPILVGSTVLTAAQGLHTAWPVVSGWLTLAASILVALHKGLDCEAVHTRCYAALAELRALIMRHEALLRGPPTATAPSAFAKLEADLTDFYVRNVRVLPARLTRVALPETG